jgi:hypothetical protein
MPFDVMLYNVPRVTQDGQRTLPIAGNRTEQFEDVEGAKKFAADHKDKFDRVVLMRREGEEQKMVERYVEGRHEDPSQIVRR